MESRRRRSNPLTSPPIDINEKETFQQAQIMLNVFRTFSEEKQQWVGLYRQIRAHAHNVTKLCDKKKWKEIQMLKTSAAIIVPAVSLLPFYHH